MPSDLDKLFDGACQVRPPIPEDQLAAVPAKRGIVLLLDEQARPIVLLTAADLRSRVRFRLEEPLDDQRRKTADLRELTREIRWRLAPSHFEADLAFLHAARAIWPRTYGSLLSWKPPWFIHVHPQEAVPHFEKTRKVRSDGGRWVGPFPSGAAAERFIEIIQDAFDLCRDIRCLRQAPHAQPCAYGQMGKCLSPCDGRITMEQYRQHVARAADYAAGRRQDELDRLRADMKQAARELQFERAGALKLRLARLEELNGQEYAFARPVEEFRFLLIQRGPGRRKLRAFLAAGGRLEMGGEVDYPLQLPQLAVLADRAGQIAHQVEPADEDLADWHMGLVAHALFSGADRRGAIVRWQPGLGAEAVAQAIEDAYDQLHLSKSSPAGQPPAEPNAPAES